MDIIYLITDNISRLKYLGSKKNWKGPNTYFGSPNCKSKKMKKFFIQKKWKSDIISRPETFTFEILESFVNIEHKKLLEIELEYQKIFDVVRSMEFINAGFAKKGYCGDTMGCLTEEGKRERKEKISKGLLKTFRSMDPEEKREKFSKFGSDNPNYGNKWSEEKRKDLASKLKGSVPSIKNFTYVEYFGEDVAKKLKENLSKIAKEKTGEKNQFYGKTHSDEAKSKMSEFRKGKKPANTRKIEINGIVYEGLNDASIDTGVKGTTLWNRINSKNKKYENCKYLD